MKTEHNYDLCKACGTRCVHCCSAEQSQDKASLDALFAKRRVVFDDVVKQFPQDLMIYVEKLRFDLGGEAKSTNPCKYLALVDEDPGCLIHPVRWGGKDVRADVEITGEYCSPNKGCYFNLYFRTDAEQKLVGERIQGVMDWKTYSNLLRDCAEFNRNWAYVISRMQLADVSMENVKERVDEIHKTLRNYFPNINGLVSEGETQMQKRASFKKSLILPTELFMRQSGLFTQWGIDLPRFLLGIETINVEGRFQETDFKEYGYFFGDTRAVYIHYHAGEILPLHFDDVAITDIMGLELAIRLIDGVLEC